MFVQKYVPERPQQLHSSGPHTGNQALQAKRGCHSGASTQRGGVTSGWGTRMGLKGVTQGEKANLRRLPRAVSTYVRTLTRQTGARPRVSPRGSLGRGHGSCGDHGGGSRKCYVSSDCTEPHTSAHARAHTHTHTHESAPWLLGSQFPGGDACLGISRRRPHWAAGQGRTSRTLLYNCPWTHNY